MYRLNVYIQEGIYQKIHDMVSVRIYTEPYKKGHKHDVK